MTGPKKRTQTDSEERGNAAPVAAQKDAADYQPKLIDQYIKELGLDLDEYQFHSEESTLGEKTTKEWLEKYCRGKMAAYENSWREGNIGSLAAAVKLCGLCDWALPPWCEAGVQKIIAQHYFEGKSSRKGRHTRVKAKQEQDHIHFMRWQMVTEFRERREELKKFGYKPTWEAAYEKASLHLRGTDASGEPGAMKDSYRRVQAAMKAGQGGRYYIP